MEVQLYLTIYSHRDKTKFIIKLLFLLLLLLYIIIIIIIIVIHVLLLHCWLVYS